MIWLSRRKIGFYLLIILLILSMPVMATDNSSGISTNKDLLDDMIKNTGKSTEVSAFAVNMFFGSTGATNIFKNFPNYDVDLNRDDYPIPYLIGLANQVVLFIALFVLIYSVSISAYNAARSGKFLDENNNVWLIIRTAVGAALIIPTKAGLCLLQIWTLWMVYVGIEAADIIWGRVLENGNLYNTNPDANQVFNTDSGEIIRDVKSLVELSACMGAHNVNASTNSDPNKTAPSDSQPYSAHFVPAGKNTQIYFGASGDTDPPCGKVIMTGNDIDRISSFTTFINNVSNNVTEFIKENPDLYKDNQAELINKLLTPIEKNISDFIYRFPVPFQPKPGDNYTTWGKYGWSIAGMLYHDLISGSGSGAVSKLNLFFGSPKMPKDDNKQSYFPSNLKNNISFDPYADRTRTTPSGSPGDFLSLYTPVDYIGNILSTNDIQHQDRILPAIIDNVQTSLSNVYAIIDGSILASDLAIGVGAIMSGMQPVGDTLTEFFSTINMLAVGAFFFIFNVVSSFLIMIVVTPALIYLMCVIGWLIQVISSVIAAPLVAMGLLWPDADPKLGKSAPALMMYINLIMRPGLILVGFLAAILLLPIAIQIFSVFFAQAANALDLTGMSIAGPILNLVFLLIYITLLAAMVTFIFSLTFEIPDRILTWIGGQAMGLGAEAAGGAAESVQEGGKQAASTIKQAATIDAVEKMRGSYKQGKSQQAAEQKEDQDKIDKS